MITTYAKELGERVKKARNLDHARDLSVLLHQEMMENCQPTRSEFITLVNMLVLTPAMIWDWVNAIPQWNEENETQ